MPFLDIIITPQADGTFTTRIYRKPTHTDLYLQWDSHHNLVSKYSVINTFTQRTKAICSSSQLLTNELQHLEEVLKQCKYPKWAINKVLHKQQDQKKTTNRRQIPAEQQTEKKYHIVVPHSQGVCKSYKTIQKIIWNTGTFQRRKTLKNLLISPKDKDAIAKKSSIIYLFRCDEIACEDEYIGESSRTFGKMYKEHPKAPSSIFEHQSTTGHKTSVENCRIIGMERHNMARAIKEAIYIRVKNPTLNKHTGKYNLPDIWDKDLYSVPELKVCK